MRVDLDAKVRARDGEDIGSVERAIVDPETRELAAFVVRTGAIFGRDIVVSRTHLEQAAEDGDAIRLDLTKDELETLPDFMPEQYMAPPPAWVAPAGYGFPATGYVWPVAVDPIDPMSVPVAMPVEDTTDPAEQPDLVTLNKGSVVMDRNGDDIGVVDDIRFDAQMGDLQGFVLRVGGVLQTLFGGGDTVEISRRDIERVGESVVYVRLSKDEIEATAQARS
jgi:sporulation protein YlmC with PRC-barrel domain